MKVQIIQGKQIYINPHYLGCAVKQSGFPQLYNVFVLFFSNEASGVEVQQWVLGERILNNDAIIAALEENPDEEDASDETQSHF